VSIVAGRRGEDRGQGAEVRGQMIVPRIKSKSRSRKRITIKIRIKNKTEEETPWSLRSCSSS
jgi:hypothetical protein